MAAVPVFLSFAAQDELLAGELLAQLAGLSRAGSIDLWCANLPGAGQEPRAERAAKLGSAALVLLLLSADYLASEVCQDEMARALGRRVQVFGIVARACDWKHGPLAGADVAVLPAGGVPIKSHGDRDEAWAEVVEVIRAAVEERPRVRPPNNLPARRLFVGREAELGALGQALGRDRHAAVTQGEQASVYGFGGVGKTALALEYAHRNLGRYPGGVWWLVAEGRPVDALVRLAPILRAHGPADVRRGIPVERTAAAEIAEDVRVALQSNPEPALVVLDNVSEPGWREMLPGGAVHVLMTARDARLVVGDKAALGVLSAGKARELAVKIAATVDSGDAALDRVVAGELGGLAVAVEMAARAVEEVFRSWSKYEAKLQAEMETLLEDPEWMGDYPRGVFAALDMSIDKCPPGGRPRRLLEAAAVFAADAVPLGWVREVAEVDPGETATDKALAELRRLGLVVVDESAETLSMHRLVWRRVRRRAEGETWRLGSRRAAGCVAAWLRKTVDVTRMAEVDARRAHVEEVLGAAEAAGSDEEALRIADRMAVHLQDRAEFLEARALAKVALDKAEQLEPENLASVATQLSNLAGIQQDLGQAADARALLERALRIVEATYGPQHWAVAMVLSNLALVHHDLGQAEEARLLLERALRIHEATYGPEDPQVARYLSNLALVHHDLRQAEEARPLLVRALRIDEATYDPEHPNVSISLSNLAMVHHDLGQAEEARPLLARALRIAEATYGPEHPDVALYLSNMAVVHQTLGQIDEARLLLVRALKIDEAAYGPEHPNVARDLWNLAMVNHALGDVARARPLLERALSIAEKMLPLGHPQRTLFANNLKNL